MAGKVTLRRASKEDAEAAAAIAAEVFADVSLDHIIEQSFGRINGTTWQDRKKREVRSQILSNPQGAIVAQRNGKVIGFVTTSLDPHARIGHILNIAVASAEQGKGVGKRLLQAAYELLVSQGATHLQIETLETNDVGRALYPRLGFREMVRKIYYFMEAGQWRAPE